MIDDGILFGNEVRNSNNVPTWYKFDAEWYRRRYDTLLTEQERTASDIELKNIWHEEMALQGRSPNPFFDEEWYLHANPDVMRSVQSRGIFESGFQHYVDIGCKNCSPHWLFSESDYFKKNPDFGYRSAIENGYLNCYNHFLEYGDLHFRSPHLFFDADLFIKSCLKKNIPFDFDNGAFRQYTSLKNKAMLEARTSWYFDPEWYLETYPEVRKDIEEGRFISSLHHYFVCSRPTEFNPNPFFDEVFYLETYSDVREAVQNRVFRNGYEHFVRAGINEKRQPSREFDLRQFTETVAHPVALGEAHVDNAFTLRIKYEAEGYPPSIEPASLDDYRALAIEKVNATLPSLFRSPLRFTLYPDPKITIILLSSGDYLSTLATLISLHEQADDNMHVIVASSGNSVERQRLEQSTTGVTFLYPDIKMPMEGLLRFALPYVTTAKICLAHVGVQFFTGSLQAIVRVLDNKICTGGSGKIIAADGSIIEAGSVLWRNGHMTAIGKGLPATADDVSFQRAIEVVQEGFVFCNTSILKRALRYLQRVDLESNFCELSVALRAVGGTLFYIPEIQVQHLKTLPPSSYTTEEHAQKLRSLFPHFLSSHAMPGTLPLYGKDHTHEIIMVFPYLPRLLQIGHSRRIFQQIDVLKKLGWHILVVGLEHHDETRLTVPLNYPEGVECRSGVHDFAQLLKERANFFQILWINGADTLTRLGPILERNDIPFFNKALILDTVTQDGSGLHAVEAHLRRNIGGVHDTDRLLREARAELSYAWLCQSIVVDDIAEARLLQELGFGNVRIVPYITMDHSTSHIPSFAERSGILLALSIYKSGDAGHDGFDWFCTQVIPLLGEYFPDGIPPIWVGGYHTPKVNLGFYERIASLHGIASTEERDMFRLMKECRIMIAPARALATQSTEVFDAASYGMPSIIGSTQMERLDWRDKRQAIDGGQNDAARFAAAIHELYTNSDLWQDMKRHAQEHVYHHNTVRKMDIALKEVLDLALGKKPVDPDIVKPVIRNPKKKLEPAPLNLRKNGNSLYIGQDPNEDFEDDQDVILPTHIGVVLPSATSQTEEEEKTRDEPNT